jgi:hypothetical protein
MGIEIITIVHERVSEGLGFALVVGKRWCWWCSCFVLAFYMAFFWGTIGFFYRCLFVVCMLPSMFLRLDSVTKCMLVCLVLIAVVVSDTIK